MADQTPTPQPTRHWIETAVNRWGIETVLVCESPETCTTTAHEDGQPHPGHCDVSEWASNEGVEELVTWPEGRRDVMGRLEVSVVYSGSYEESDPELVPVGGQPQPASPRLCLTVVVLDDEVNDETSCGQRLARGRCPHHGEVPDELTGPMPLPDTPTDPERGYLVTHMGDHWTVSYGTRARSNVFATCTTANDANIVRRAVELLAATEAAGVRGEPHTPTDDVIEMLRSEYDELRKDADLLAALVDQGVSEWHGYDAAFRDASGGGRRSGGYEKGWEHGAHTAEQFKQERDEARAKLIESQENHARELIRTLEEHNLTTNQLRGEIERLREVVTHAEAQDKHELQLKVRHLGREYGRASATIANLRGQLARLRHELIVRKRG